MSFTCSICGVALDLVPGSVTLLGEDEQQKRTRWIQQAGQHFSAIHQEVMGSAIIAQGAIGLLIILSAVRTDDETILQRFTAERKHILAAVSAVRSPRITQEATVS